MTIVIGTGKRRQIAIVPCAAVIKASSEESQKQLVSDFCKLAGIK